jgi:S-adenosylhomocysteine hydrolase
MKTVEIITDEKSADKYLLAIHKCNILESFNMSVYFLNEAVAKLNIISSRKNLRSAMTDDEHLDMILLRQKVEAISSDIEQLKNELAES